MNRQSTSLGSEHLYRGIRVMDSNARERYTIRCVVLADEHPLPPSDYAQRRSGGLYEWGYFGSGPGALAHALLTYQFGHDTAQRYHDAFEVTIARLPREQGGEEWRMTSAELRAWLDQERG